MFTFLMPKTLVFPLIAYHLMLQVIDYTLATAVFCLDIKGPDPLLTAASRCHFLFT